MIGEALRANGWAERGFASGGARSEGPRGMASEASRVARTEGPSRVVSERSERAVCLQQGGQWGKWCADDGGGPY